MLGSGSGLISRVLSRWLFIAFWFLHRYGSVSQQMISFKLGSISLRFIILQLCCTELRKDVLDSHISQATCRLNSGCNVLETGVYVCAWHACAGRLYQISSPCCVVNSHNLYSYCTSVQPRAPSTTSQIPNSILKILVKIVISYILGFKKCHMRCRTGCRNVTNLCTLCCKAIFKTYPLYKDEPNILYVLQHNSIQNIFIPPNAHEH